MSDNVIAVRGKWYNRVTHRFLGPVVEGEPKPTAGLLPPAEKPKEIAEMTRVELAAVAKERGIEGVSTMKKSDLLVALGEEEDDADSPE